MTLDDAAFAEVDTLTAMYIMQKIKDIGEFETIKITRIGRGLPTGADVEYADGQTLIRALEGRCEM